MAGVLRSGTSGFAYPGWRPRFYPAGLRLPELLPFYANSLPAVELNNTFYQQPSSAKIAAWLGATPASFRFAVKAQRGGALRAMLRSPEETVPWLTAPLPAFGERLGAVLFRVPAEIERDRDAEDPRLAALLAAWPEGLPLVLEFQHPSWQVDETFDELRRMGATLCATELPEDDGPPTIRLTGSFLYLRLRRHEYEPAEIRRWADRIAPFLDDGVDVYAFFRHDESGRATELARELATAVEAIRR